MAYEMLIGGEFPVIVGGKGFSQTIKHNPIAAAAQVFSRIKNFDFDVLVVDRNDRVKNHIFCQVKPGDSDKATVLLVSGQRTAEAHAMAGPFHAGSQSPTISGANGNHGRESGSPSSSNTTPTYTQKMAYQSVGSSGQFHIFSSQPSALASRIVTSQSLMEQGHDTQSHGSSEQANWLTDTQTREASSSVSMNSATSLNAGSPASPVALGKRERDDNEIHGRDLKSDVQNEDGAIVQGSDSSSSAKKSKLNADGEKPRGDLQQEVDFLSNTLGQNITEIQSHLARHQRPAVFGHIYRAQLAQSPGMATNTTLPEGHTMQTMMPIPLVPTASADKAYHNTAALLGYNFPVTMPPIHDAGPHSVVADFMAMQNPETMVDISDPTSLDRFLGYNANNMQVMGQDYMSARRMFLLSSFLQCHTEMAADRLFDSSQYERAPALPLGMM